MSFYLIGYRVLPQGERQCLDLWYEALLTQGNLVSFIINLVEYLVINSYSVTVLDNFRKETSDRAKKHLFWRYSTASLSFWGKPLHLHGPPSWMKV